MKNDRLIEVLTYLARIRGVDVKIGDLTLSEIDAAYRHATALERRSHLRLVEGEKTCETG